MRDSISKGVMPSPRSIPGRGPRSAAVQKDLLPDRRLVEEDVFAPQTPGAELGMRSTEDVDLRPAGRAERPPAVMPAVQAPAQCGARRHQGIVAADPVLDAEHGIGEAGAQTDPEAVGVAMAVTGDAAWMFELAG